MKEFLSVLACSLLSGMLIAQVGIGTTTPAAKLDIRATSQTTPSSTDGLLIPKVDEFPSTSPGLAQDGMLIYVSGSGSIAKGYYFWNHGIAAWVSLLNWISNGTDIERQSGDVYIGDLPSTNNNLYISHQIIDWDNGNYFLDPSVASFVNEISYDAGSPGDPSIYFTDSNTGFYSPGTAEVACSTNGSISVLFDAERRVELFGTKEATESTGSGVLEIANSLRIDGDEIITNTNSTLSLQSGNNGDLQVDDTTLVVDASLDRVGIGTSSPAFQLELSADSAAKPTSALWTVSSDKRLKQNVRPFTDGLELIEKINPVWFTYNGKAGMPLETGVGTLAQDFQEIAPYMVKPWRYRDEDRGVSEEYLGINYSPLMFVAVNAIKEQQDKIKALVDEVSVLKSEIEQLKQFVVQNN